MLSVITLLSPQASILPARSSSYSSAIGLRLKSHTQESEEPKHRPRIDWKADHQSPVHSHDDAIEKLDRYAISWKNETFHKILKSGCKVEEARLRTAESPRKPHCCLLHPGLAGGG